MADSLLQVPQARKLLGDISQATIYKLFRSGALPSVKLGRRRYVRESDLATFIRSLGQVIGAVSVLLFVLAAELTPAEREEIRAQVRESRIKQGLPPTVQDPGVLARLAAAVLERSDGKPAPKEEAS